MKKITFNIIFFVLFIFFGCNKTGIKGTVTYAPTGEILEDVDISAIPELKTEERASLIKKGKTDKNGEYKITGLERKYSYAIVIQSNKFIDINSKNPLRISGLNLIEDQTYLISNPIKVMDIIPGTGCFVKRQNGDFEEVSKYGRLNTYELTGGFRGVGDFKMHTYTNPKLYFTNNTDISSANPTKVKNGEIIYFNITSDGTWSINYWHISPLTKVQYNENCASDMNNLGITQLLVAGNIYFERFFDNINRISCLGIEKTNISKKDPRNEPYYQVFLGKGYYMISSYDFTDKSNTRSQPVFNFIIEVIDEPEGELEEGE